MRKLKRLDLLIKEVVDPFAQENFWRLRQYTDNIDQYGIVGPQGPQGPIGPAGPAATTVPTVTKVFTTDLGTAAKDLVYINAANTVTKVTSNSAGVIPHGIFGIGIVKPTTLSIEVLFMGTVSGYAGFTPGQPLFVSTSGTLTHTVPTTGMVQRVGWAISATEIFVQLTAPYRRA